jgi:hypothetical protein
MYAAKISRDAQRNGDSLFDLTEPETKQIVEIVREDPSVDGSPAGPVAPPMAAGSSYASTCARMRGGATLEPVLPSARIARHGSQRLCDRALRPLPRATVRAT